MQPTLESIKSEVLHWMSSKPFFTNKEIQSLNTIDLGFLRRNSTQKHGVCRFHRGTDVHSATLGPNDVKCIDLHPHLLTEDWKEYGKMVLYHEFLHALGNFAHDANFRRLEGCWENQISDAGRTFTELMRRENATWLWVCPSCEKEHPRRKKGAGKYRCRKCNIGLNDVEV
jgi:predicted SprT family Zn-dependent metalloprotease